MKVKVELQGYLEDYSPNGKRVFEYEVPDGARVADVVRKLGLPEELATIIVVSSRPVDMQEPLAENDHVTVIPPLAGG